MRKAIVVIAVSFVVVAVFVAGYIAWGSWVSPPEKRAMNVALQRIEDLSHCESTVTDGEKERDAQAAIAEAKRVRVTAYDKQLVEVLNDLLFSTAQAECTARRNTSRDQRYAKQSAVDKVNQQSVAMLRDHLR